MLGYPRGYRGTHPSWGEGGHTRPALTSYRSSVCPREAKALAVPAGLVAGGGGCVHGRVPHGLFPVCPGGHR